MSFTASNSHKSLASLQLKGSFRTGDDDLVAEFYAPVLERATIYDRAVGYFRSSVFHLVGQSFLNFARNGGKARFLCSPSLTEEDLNALSKGYKNRSEVIGTALDREFDLLFEENELQEATKFLATLIKFEVLDLRLALRQDGTGIYHEKTGIFTDAYNNCISFVGSANETLHAWHPNGNLESLEVFCSWLTSDELRVTTHKEHFLRLWYGENKGVLTLDFPQAQKDRLIQKAANNLAEIEKSILASIKPKETKGRELFPHQKEAIAAWEACGKRGILEHATGSGKTVTALAIIRKHLQTGNPAIVLMPNTLLLDQWHSEILKELPGTSVLLAGGGHNDWKTPGILRAHTTPDLGVSSIVLSTMQTAANPDFLRGMWQGDHLLLVVDEVHQIGSPKNSNALSINSGSSLGLSATPRRYGDPEGTQKILDRMGDVVQPVFTLADAIEAGRLVKYTYHPHFVTLEDNEFEAWVELTRRIGLELNREAQHDSENASLSHKAKMLILQRARIIKKARGKLSMCARIINQHFEPGQSWLIYCEDSDQLNEVMEILKSQKLRPLAYHSGMLGDRDGTLNFFRKHGGILVSIKCLDEGVDIPSISHALILASSQNPRQFIQRRGRVLRYAKDKYLATIHDTTVVPSTSYQDKTYLSMVKPELLRAIEFAGHALNQSASTELREMAIKLGLHDNISDLFQLEHEEEE